MHALALGVFLLLAQAPEPQTVIICNDGMVFTGVVRDDLPAGVVLKKANGELIFIERARIKSVAKPAGAAPAPPASEAPPPAPPPAAPPTPPAASSVPLAEPSSTNLAESWGKRDVLKMSPMEIDDEIHWLVENRPPMGSITLGIVFGSILSAVGVALITVGDAVWGYKYRSSCLGGSFYCSSNDLTANTLYVGIGIGSLIVGVALLTLGIVFKIIKGPARNAMNARIQQLEDRRDRLEAMQRYKQGSLEPPPLGGITVATF